MLQFILAAALVPIIHIHGDTPPTLEKIELDIDLPANVQWITCILEGDQKQIRCYAGDGDQMKLYYADVEIK